VSTTDPGGVATPQAMPRAVGVLAEAAPLLLHGKPIASHALRALRDARVDVVPADLPWKSVLALGLPLVVHDPACPLTPATFIDEMVDRVSASDRVQVGCRPVTDTIKVAISDRVGSTVDRESLFEVTAPVVVPLSVLGALGSWPDLSDVAGLVTGLRVEHVVDLVPAPSLGRRVDDESDVLLLEAFEELDRGN
jgi:2-C-methyl-D-erythritol 4-phosphate cytidylyltransferase